ncbi:M23 family metallopeptidase [Treponema sp.]|uniref:M23 family metallopeptidase n=1 Tax=Treponema sp. TaxID=166 RepID=UPI003F099BC0
MKFYFFMRNLLIPAHDLKSRKNSPAAKQHKKIKHCAFPKTEIFRVSFFLILSAFFSVATVFPQNFPEIPALESRDFLFSQYQQEVQESQKELFRENSAEPSFYSYKAKKGDSVITVAARCSIWQETLSTVNSIDTSSEPLEGKTIILPTANGLFIPENPNSSIEILLSNEHSEKISLGNSAAYKINGRLFFFIPGARFSPAERAYFLNPGMSMPLEKSILTSSYGKRKSPITGKWQFHRGIDLAAPEGTPVFACKSGTVKKIERGNRIYGNLIVLSHAGGLESYYAHLSAILTEEGSAVATGQKIGEVGSTGLATGPHLHFEIKQNGSAQNPEKFLK